MKKQLISMLLCLCILFLPACTPPTFTMCAGSTPQPEDTVEEFFICLRSGNYDGADALVQNMTTLGFSGTFTDELYIQMAQYLTDSRSYSQVGDCVVKGHSAEMTIRLTVLDFRKVETVLSQTATTAVSELEYAGTEVDDSMLDGIIQSSLTQLMMNPVDYYSTEEITIQLRYEDDQWKLICSDELYSALVGYIV